MKIILAVISSLILLAGSPSESAKLDWSISPSVSLNRGYTEYELDASGTYFDSTFNQFITQRIRSLLEFPMDVLMVGVEFQLRSEISPIDYWGLQGSIQTNITNPGKKMIDSDWESIAGLFDMTMFSYTESDAEAKAMKVSLQGYRRLFGSPKVSVALLAGFEYYKIDQDLIGYEGWQRFRSPGSTTFPQPYAVAGTGLAITYRVTYKMPQIGFMTRLQMGNKNRAELKTLFMPVFASDVDDHVLRYKLSTSDGNGKGFKGELRIHLVPKNQQDNEKLFFDIVADYTKISLSTKQTQRWYGDEVAPNETIPAGTTIPGIPHDIRSSQYSFGIRLGFNL